MGLVKHQLSLLTVVLGGLVLLGLLTVMTVNRLEQNKRLWEVSLTKQGAFLLSSFEAASRAGMRMRQHSSEERLQFLAEEMDRVGLVVRVVLLDGNGLVLVHSDPERVGAVEPEAKRYWSLARPAFSTFTKDGFMVGRLFRPLMPFGPHRPKWSTPQELEPRLGLVILPLDEYRAARGAELRQALLAGTAIFVSVLALLGVLLFFHNRRLLARLKLTTGHLVEEMPAGLVSADLRGRVITTNLEAKRIWGLKPDQETKEFLTEVLSGELMAKIKALEPNLTLTDDETVLLIGDQKIPVALSAVRLNPAPDDPTAFILLLRDLREVKRLEERLERSERLAALGRLSAGVAHEIRNPLSSIRGLAQYLHNRLPAGSDEAGYARVMISEADRLNRVINDLLAYARPKPPLLAPGDLNHLAAKVADLMKDQARAAGVALVLDLDQSLPQVSMDSDQVTQVIINLVLNAVESGAARVELATRASGPGARLRISDDGPGVPAEAQSHIFDPFYTTKAKGSGLGLAISQRIIEEHGGRLELKDRPGGAIFELELPADPEATDGANPPHPHR